MRIWNNFCEESQTARDHSYIMTWLKALKLDKINAGANDDPSSLKNNNSFMKNFTPSIN